MIPYNLSDPETNRITSEFTVLYNYIRSHYSWRCNDLVMMMRSTLRGKSRTTTCGLEHVTLRNWAHNLPKTLPLDHMSRSSSFTRIIHLGDILVCKVIFTRNSISSIPLFSRWFFIIYRTLKKSELLANLRYCTTTYNHTAPGGVMI